MLAAVLMLSSLAPIARAQEGALGKAGAGTGQNVLVGVGVVIGLPGTGDSSLDTAAVDHSVVGLLRRAGLEPWRDQIKPGWAAVVMLSAALPAGVGDGTKIAVTVSALGDARSIAGGTLLITPLRAADGAVRAIGQGTIAMDDASSTSVLATETSGRLRTGKLAEGAVVKQPLRDTTYALLGQ